jgi:DNA processing protein
MVLSDEQRYLLWLSAAEISANRVTELIGLFGSAKAVWDAFGTASSPKFMPKSKRILEENHTQEKLNQLIAQLEEKHVHLLFQDDADYPPLLREISDPPYLLYYAGKLDCLKQPCVALVGTRTPSDYGRHMACDIAAGLCEAGVTVVSGLARGIDYAAHEGALKAGGCTVGVLGCGINRPYPSEHTPMLRRIASGKGLIISEYPLDSTPLPFHFPYRNRIIAGLSVGTVLVEGRIQSGGMHTVTSALDQGREVFAVPGQKGYIGAEGPLTIMREGARPVTSARDILEDLSLVPLMAPYTRPKRQPRLPVLQLRILRALRVQPMGVDELAAALKTGPEEIMTETSIMEINGLLRREAGNSFALPRQ